MNDAEKLQTLITYREWSLGDHMDKAITDALDYAIQCCEATQSRAKTLRYDEITEPGIYLAKTEVGDEVIPLTIRADQINLGTVFVGFTYQGPLVWREEE